MRCGTAPPWVEWMGNRSWSKDNQVGGVGTAAGAPAIATGMNLLAALHYTSFNDHRWSQRAFTRQKWVERYRYHEDIVDHLET